MKRSMLWITSLYRRSIVAAMSFSLLASLALAQSQRPTKPSPLTKVKTIAGSPQLVKGSPLPLTPVAPRSKPGLPLRRLPGPGLASAGPQPEPPSGPINTVGFDHLLSRTATTAGQTLRHDYRQIGVSFPDGLTIVQSGGAEVQRARSGSMVASSLQHGEFACKPLRMELTHPQRQVSLYVMLMHSGSGEQAVATLEAFDASGRSVAKKTANFRSDGRNWTKLEVASPAVNIHHVSLTGGSAEFPASNFLLIDDLSFAGGTGTSTTPVDREAPVVTILAPVANTKTRERVLQARVRVTENQYLSEVTYRLVREGSHVDEPWLRLAGGINDPAPDKLLDRTWSLQLGQGSGPSATRYGKYTLTVRARDISGNQAERSIQLHLEAPPAADVWVLGMEYNQGYQDVIYTDLNRGSATGWVPLGHPTGRDSTLALPITPGKPMVVRVYVGLRDMPNPPPGGVPVTGRLRVESPEVGGQGRTLRPLSSNDCFDHLGRSMPSVNPVRAFGTLGTLGLRTQSPHCIDLIAARTHWAGTLNFVIPAEFTKRLTNGAQLRAIVEPVGFQEAKPTDNEFQLSLQNVNPPETAKIRLVRLSPDGIPAPSTADARRVVRDMAQFTKYPQIEIVSDEVLAYRRGTVTIRSELLGLEVVEERLDECNTLWLMLAQRYGLKKDETLLALLPRGLVLRGCGSSGVGWRVPKLQAFRGATGGPVQPDYYGGAAWALMPEVSAEQKTYWDQVSTVAHEFYHAHLDARHEETGNGESAGAFLSGRSGAGILEFASDAAGFNLDFDAAKPPKHKNGVIGEYPTASVELGRPGEGGIGHFAAAIPGSTNRNMNKVIGYLGGMGVRIEPVGTSYRLTLYDPCPTGPLDRKNPLAILRQRINSNSQYDPQLDDSLMPHGFMSYSTNRWITGRHSPNVMNLNHAY